MVRAHEEAIAGFCGSEGAPRQDIFVQLSGQRTVKGYPSGPSLKLLDEEKSLARIDISHPEAERFPKTQPGAVEQQNQGSVQASPEPRPIQWLAEFEQLMDIFLR
jgi:hypothetical protein